MRELGFRAYIKPLKRYATGLDTIQFHKCCDVAGPGIWTVVTLNEGIFEGDEIIIEQDTGLKDKNGKEIYENCELDGRYRVEYIAPKFVGKDMVKGDIIELYDNKFTITKEHCEISQNSERGTN